MKTKCLFLPLVAAACACPVLAEDVEVEEKPVPRPAEPLMRVVDRNGDGSLQQAEIDMAVAALRGLDRDRDGTVSAEELAVAPAGGETGAGRRPDRPAAPGEGGPQGAPDFSRLDANGDGKISKDEAPERMRERFDVIDGNGDGFLDKPEQEELVKRMRERFRQPGQPGRPGFGADQGGTTGGEKPKRPAPIE